MTSTATLIPPALLASADRVLFIAHLALGDFTYLQNQFKAFARAYPHLRMDLWVDEVRRTADAAQWPHLKNYVLYDWAEGCGLFHTVYRETYSPALMAASIRTAQDARYPIVISLATLRPHLYAALARQIAGKGLAVGMRGTTSLFQLHHLLAYHRLDATIAPRLPPTPAVPVPHITAVYTHWFRQLAGVEIGAEARFPFVDIPAQWTQEVAGQLSGWGFDGGKCVFINPYAKTRKRCWPLERVTELIEAMQREPQWREAGFIVNAVPQELATARAMFDNRALPRTQLFSAEKSFYELPAMLAQCNLIISVETAVMHLANAVHVPVIALMRQKNPEWVPVDSDNSVVITTRRRRDWVREITVDQVMQEVKETRKLQPLTDRPVTEKTP